MIDQAKFEFIKKKQRHAVVQAGQSGLYGGAKPKDNMGDLSVFDVDKEYRAFSAIEPQHHSGRAEHIARNNRDSMGKFPRCKTSGDEFKY